MAFKAKSGKEYTNKSMADRDNKRSGSKDIGKEPHPEKDEAQTSDSFEPENGSPEPEQDGAGIAAQHGPASDVAIQHDPMSGQSSVTAKHPDGHSHQSMHPTPDAAHKFAADCSGVGNDNTLNSSM